MEMHVRKNEVLITRAERENCIFANSLTITKTSIIQNEIRLLHESVIKFTNTRHIDVRCINAIINQPGKIYYSNSYVVYFARSKKSLLHAFFLNSCPALSFSLD